MLNVGKRLQNKSKKFSKWSLFLIILLLLILLVVKLAISFINSNPGGDNLLYNLVNSSNDLVSNSPLEEREVSDDFVKALVVAAMEQTTKKVTYDPAYFSIDYPNGDVPSDKGVCTDVVIRAYRAVGVDLQELVHEDMKKNFNLYPNNWGLKTTDTNIDHRRVPNLQIFFSRFGSDLDISSIPSDYLPGDIVVWKLPNGLKHIGLVVNYYQDGVPLIVHNIGAGPKLENRLFLFEIISHYRYR